ncbi:acyl-CoA thioesterase YciA [Amphritea japonica ATCC BAA-1530]|uniref:Acyl-CoA thioesterase YciA n=2 Tax=Amphritea TaxID=515417 RepID=A0A7R6P4C5_9GAMM|nr:acyl-CoA thioesterase YciA [Amphritea japonica ATCC BAA-1530]
MTMSKVPAERPSLRTIAMPGDSNPDGDIFGGWIMAQMDIASGGYASRKVKCRVVTIAVDAMTFLKPVYIGDDVSCYCSVARYGKTSLVVHVETWVQRHHSEVIEKVTEGNFTFVAIDDQGRPTPIVRDNE